MNVLIAVLSCNRDQHLHQTLRDTCYQGDSLHRFFMGKQAAVKAPDEVVLGCDDGYADLPFKTQAMCRWAIREGYDYLFKCDTDTYVFVNRLLDSGFEQHDYIGYYRGPISIGCDDRGNCSYASGGSGYWLSRKAMEIVAAADFIQDYWYGKGYVRGEDLQVGRALGAAGIFCHWDERYRLYDIKSDIITLHDRFRPMRSEEEIIRTHKIFHKRGIR